MILIKTTLGLLALVAARDLCHRHRQAAQGPRAGVRPDARRSSILSVAILAGMDIGARHILPVYALSVHPGRGRHCWLAARAGAGSSVGAVLVAAHIVSALAVFPNYIAYANEAWGGPKNVHNLLSDANVDWAQQLFQVKEWQDRHPGEECWFAYFAYPEIDPATYGIHCHHLPTVDTFWLGGADIIPPVIDGTVLISAGDLSGCEWPSSLMNPYAAFQRIKPEEMIDYGVMVYRGRFDMRQAAVEARAAERSRAHADRRRSGCVAACSGGRRDGSGAADRPRVAGRCAGRHGPQGGGAEGMGDCACPGAPTRTRSPGRARPASGGQAEEIEVQETAVRALDAMRAERTGAIPATRPHILSQTADCCIATVS